MDLPGDAEACAADRRRTAAAGEDAAAGDLERRGFTVLSRNLRVGRDEIDILALDPDGVTIVVIEVKCRTRAGACPEDRVDHRKRHRLSRAALALSTRREFRGASFRFDVISVVAAGGAEPRIDHWRHAFEAE